MANPFDIFDQEDANPFDQFDGPPAASVRPMARGEYAAPVASEPEPTVSSQSRAIGRRTEPTGQEPPEAPDRRPGLVRDADTVFARINRIQSMLNDDGLGPESRESLERDLARHKRDMEGVEEAYSEAEEAPATDTPEAVAREPMGAARRAARRGEIQGPKQDPVPVSDLFRRVARGATEIGAALPEAAAIAGAGNPNASSLFASEEVGRAEEQIRMARERLSVPGISEENRRMIEDVIAAEERKIAAYRPLAGLSEGPLKPAAKDRPLYQKGGIVRDASQELFGTPDPQFDDRFMAKLAEGAGSMAGFVGATLLTGPVGGAASGSALNTAGMYREAIQEGATEEEAKTAAYIGSVIGASEVIPISRAFGMIPSEIRKKAATALGRRATNAFATSGEEGLQEAMQGIANNLTAKGVYDPDRQVISGDIGEDMLIGAILGGGVGLVAPSPPANLSQSDIASPLQNETISQGKAAMDAILSGQPAARSVAEAPAVLDTGPGIAPGAAQPDGPIAPSSIDAPARVSPPVRPAAPVADALPEAALAATADDVNPFDQFDTPEPVEAPDGASGARHAPDADDYAPGLGGSAEWAARRPMPDLKGDEIAVTDGKGNPTGEIARRNPESGRYELVQAGEEPRAQQPQETAPQVDQDVDKDLAQRTSPRQIQILTNEDLTSVEPEPEVFQYKSGGDAAGVTDRLLNVRNWDTAKAGSAIVYEYRDGRRVVADGHQRLGLAKRMREQGQDVEMPVIVRREVDGYTPQDVMVEAAAKNIGEYPGKGQPDHQQVVDAGKVLRSVSDANVEDLNLDPTSPLARQARDVRGLSDEAFGMFVNEVADVRNASAVGRVVNDKAVHADILRVMGKLNIRNAFEAEQVARQAAADTTVSTQESLFGDEQVSESLYLERARVMDNAIKRLRKDRSTFNTLLQRGAEITDAGNRLDQDANQKRVLEDATVQEYLTRQANSKGPISEALTEAARAVKDGTPIGQVVTSFVGNVRGSVQGDFQASEGVERAGRIDEPARATEAGAAGPVGSEREGWVVRERDSGNVVMETRDRKKVDALNTERFEAVPVAQHLAELNQDTPARSAMRGDAGEVSPTAEPVEPSEAAAVAAISDKMKKFLTRAAGKTGAADNTLVDQLLEAQKNGWVRNHGAPQNSSVSRYKITDEGRAVLTGQATPATERTEAGEQTVIPGAEQDAERSAAAREADQRREVDARARQSRMGTTAPQDAPGGLFDDQGDMFDTIPEAEEEIFTPDQSHPLAMAGMVPIGDGSIWEWHDGAEKWRVSTKYDEDGNQSYDLSRGREKIGNYPDWVTPVNRMTQAGFRVAKDAPAFVRALITAQPVDQGNMFDRKEQRREVSPSRDRLGDFIPAAQQRLKQLAIQNVDLAASPDMDARGAIEFGRDGNMRIIIGNTLDGEHTVNHESIHALKAMNLFKDKEWKALEAEARKTWMQRYDVAKVYPDLDAAGQVEEAIAEAFADYIRDGKKPATTALQNVFAKMKRFFRAMRETLTGQGITRVEDIFDIVDEGQVGQRSGEGQDGETRYQRPAAAARQMSPNMQEGIAQATNSALLPKETTFERFRTSIQDRFLSLRRLDEATAKATGQEAIDKRESVYYAEERYSGRTGHALQELDDQYVRKLVNSIANRGIEIEDTDGAVLKDNEAASLWLMARHAKERNAQIAEINPAMPDGGSGMTDAEADEILSRAAPHQAALDEIGATVDKLTGEMIDLRERVGLLSAEEAETWRRMYDHYVPLRDFAEDDMYDGKIGGDIPRVGRKFNTRGPESQRAMGRSSRAFDPLSTILAQAQETIVRAEKNIVGKSMLRYAQKYENPALYEISDVESQRFFNRETGQVETRQVGPTARQMADNEMAVKVDGKEYRITFKDERLARAMGQVGVEQLNGLLQAFSHINRYFSAMYTMLSPTFVITNAFRDGMAAEVNLGAFGGKDAGKLRKAAARDWVKSFLGAKRGLKGKADTEYSKWFKEFSEAGGKVHFWQIENPGDGKIDFSKRVWLESGSPAAKAAKKMMRLNTRDNPLLHGIESINMAVDNAVRLATYAEARKNGWTKEDAASLSKNLTVNFNRRGEIGAALNAFWIFFNAAVQGSQVTLKAMKAPAVKKAVTGMVLYGFASDIMASMLSGEDDDGELEYDQIPAYKSQRSLILPTPIGEDGYITVPLPYGYNMFFHAGQQMGKIARGVKDPKEAAGDILKTGLEAFSPISGDDVMSAVSPQILRIATEFAQNEDWLGRQIRPENPYGDYGPQSYKEFNPTDISRLVARGMNTATGGSSVESGMIDISPEYIDHFFKVMTGGMGTFLQNSWKLGERAATGTLDETRPNELPLMRVLYTTSGDFLNQSRYYDFREAVTEAGSMVKKARAGDEDYDTADISDKMMTLNSLGQGLKLAEKRRKSVQEKIDAVYAKEGITEAMRQKLLKPLIDHRNKVFVQFNRSFIEKMGPQAE